MGFSMGALVAAHMMNSVIGRSMFSGVLVLNPFFRDLDNKVANVLKFSLPLSYIRPKFYISSLSSGGPSEEYKQKYSAHYGKPEEDICFAMM